MAELSVWIAGEAGQGMVTVGQILSKAVVRSGLHLLVQQDYMSRIRGGLNSWRMRCGDGELFGPREEADVLVALSPEAAKGYGRQLCKEGLLLVDERLEIEGERGLALPLSELDAVRFPGTVALAACSHFMGLAPHVLDEVMGSFFSGETLEENRAVFFRAMEWAEKTIPQRKLKIPKTFPPALTLNGNEGIALGALASGCNFAAYYPMTPATSVVQTLIDHQGHTDLHVEQVEDEISAINMALGASYAGARAMVATSGGGLALMSEGVSLSGITETPVVIVLAQRPGPATGLPTRTEQGDLDLARFCGHGEFSRAILAPDSPASCFELTRHAFDLAERFQGPVFILTDQFLADSVRNTPCFDFSNRTQPASPLLSPSDSQPYQRYALGHEGGVSPRLVPGFSKALVVTDSDEHTPDGHLTEDHGIRVAMQKKRMAKERGLHKASILPQWDGEDDPHLLFLSWGSSSGACREAAHLLQERKTSVATLHFSQLWPVNGEVVRRQMQKAMHRVVVESNSTGQFARLLFEQTGICADRTLLRFDGLPISGGWIVEELLKEELV